ncbi:MAG TPA: phosphoenolpyruvate--protein phosphotransferase [Actinomycetota bacterium]|nr:phosphoenolpyruvate--protein phosphotransferase [Actinomycetota bacterium]
MIGIVLVSHSHSIAEGAAELARQMGGEDVRIETAGGLEGPEHAIGTDAVLVQQAIERAWSDDGVLVLMDLGSAVLSAEMALDLLPEDRRERIRLTEAPFVEGAVAAAVTARIGASLDEVAAEARGALAAKATHLGAEPATAPAPEPAPAARGDAGGSATVELEVRTAHGLHARPAASFVRTAASFDVDVQVTNLSTGRGPASGRSLNAVAMLGVGHGQRIEVSASGPQAREVVEALRALADRNFDEEPEEAAEAAAPLPAAVPVPRPEGTIGGLPASPGVAVGPIRRFHTPTLEVVDRPAGTPDEERAALDAALEATRLDVQEQRTAVAGRAGAYRAAIFDAHLLLLEDEALVSAARRSIDAGTAAPRAWRDAVADVAHSWEALEDEYQRERAADVWSVGDQVLARLLGVPAPRPRLDEPGIFVTADLAPADAAALDPATALGVATAFGGPTSHAAVLARSLGIPAVVGLGDEVLDLAEGTPAALDGEAGVVIVDPAPDVVDALEARRRELERADREARADAGRPAVTRDGVSIEVAANVGTPDDVPAAVAAGCDGVGLFRTEFLFMEREAMPSEEEQEAAYRAAAEALGGRPMIVRTLDAGADKPIPYLEQPAEANPFLGVRGLRLGLERPELLDRQLRAVLRVAADHPVRVMFPMVSMSTELRRGREAVERARAAVGSNTVVEVGVMIEVPSAALAADRLAEDADFFSIGTNDLTQYTFAAERGNERVAALADPLHPAVLSLIRRSAEAAEARGRWTGVCGEIAGDPSAAPLLLGLGVRELSMSAPAIPHVKRVVRETDLAEARVLADAALAAGSADEVRELLRRPAPST